jgi:hypothetical protein
LGNDVESKQAVLRQFVVSKAHNDEDDSQDSETTQLDWLATDCINSCHGYPVTWDGPRKNNNGVPDCSVEEHLIDCWTARITNRLQDHGVVERKPIISAVVCQ